MLARIGLVALTLAATAGCFPAKAPMKTALYEGSDDSRTLLVMLPGFGARYTAFEKKGILDVARDAGLTNDILTVDMTYGYYISNRYDERLQEDVFDKVRDDYDDIWVLGISMGGLGTLLTTKAFSEDVDGAILLSPFLGRRKTMRAIQAQGIDGWQPPADDPKWDESLWGWMKGWEDREWSGPPLLLGHGDRDLGMRNLNWMASQLPDGRVEVQPGGHAWTTWAALTRVMVRDHLLELPAFGGTPTAAAQAPETPPDVETAEEIIDPGTVGPPVPSTDAEAVGG